ncbi:DUF2225 domain-containing protein [Haliovirga abyssi]|uniref:Response regulatory domain-containing protein n=1 Tax=Haliovirga abyssi TaxID=2996794 RepID=A0AAU9DL04_9FUSO|nr:DUF2225 domain-containing protein [Haliovirga abyssi]BDU50592.1 hypothetical protein HLVA_11610 [Haliovirga abyssi]
MDEKIFYEIDLTCPACGHNFKSTKTKTKIKETTPIGTEAYLVAIYQTETMNPMSYEIDVCPHCYYAGFHKDFIDKGNKRRHKLGIDFKEELQKLGKNTDFNVIYKNNELARMTYVLAAYIYSKENPIDYLKLGKCYIRTAWYSKELKEIDFYRTALKKALDTYMNAYNEIDEFSISTVLLYLIAVINMELGDYEGAAPFINKLNGDLKAKKLNAIKDKLEEQTIILRKVLKEIEVERKTMTDEEKKKDKKDRREAVRVKPYKVPFGIELRTPSVSGLGKREEKKTNKLEEDYGVKLTGKPTVLIVDDSKIVRASLKQILMKDCDIVGIATNGSEGVQMYQAFNPDFVTMDIEMPGMNGIEALQKIKKIDKDAKVIMLSSLKDSKKVYEAIKAGAMNYLLKPVNSQKILELIKKS